MAEKRMFAQSIVMSDAFLDMPLSSRCLYFTLGMLADDDGFVGNPKAIMRQSGASNDDMNLLITKRYVLQFDSGVIVIKHWRINNYLRSDRYKQTTYLEEKNTLLIDDNGAYTQKNKIGIPSGIPSIDKSRVDKNSIDKNKRFTPPTLEEIKSYIQEKQLNVDADKFYNYFTEGKWVDMKGNKVKNWKQKLLTWDNNSKPIKKQEEAVPQYNASNNPTF